MFNSIQLFGLLMLGGLAAGEISRRLVGLPRTTGYVLFGMAVGQSGLKLVTPLHIENAQLFVDLALGLILFELGYQVPRSAPASPGGALRLGLGASLGAGGLVLAYLVCRGYPTAAAAFAAALCVATSPAITIATCSDVGARGPRTGLLYTLVATNGAVAFMLVALILPFVADTAPIDGIAASSAAIGSIFGALVLGGACAGLVLLGAEWLPRQPEHQHLLILGTIVLGVGMAVYLEVSVLLPMLIFGILTRAADGDNKVVAIRIASDARIFLVITFVLAGAALDTTHLAAWWPEALLIAALRFVGQFGGIWLARRREELDLRTGLLATVGLQPMSSVALVLLANTQTLYGGLPGDLAGMLLATILLLQLTGPLATQTAISGFGEALRLRPRIAVPPLEGGQT